MSEKVLLGYCGVDSGQIMLADPCYISGGFSYDEVCGSHDVGCDHSGDESSVFGWHQGFGGTIPSINGGAVVTSTGFGDGVYPVYAEIEDHGAWGKRVARVTIEFLLDEEE